MPQFGVIDNVLLRAGPHFLIRLDQDKVRLGASVESDIQLCGASIEEVHCQLDRTAQGTLLLVDLAHPRSDLQVQGVSAPTHHLQPGDQVALGGWSFSFEGSPDEVKLGAADTVMPLPVVLVVKDGNVVSMEPRAGDGSTGKSDRGESVAAPPPPSRLASGPRAVVSQDDDPPAQRSRLSWLLLGLVALAIAWPLGRILMERRDVAERWSQVEVLRARRDEARAATALQQLLVDFPDHGRAAEARLMLREIEARRGRIALAQGRLEQAVESLSQALELSRTPGAQHDPGIVAELADLEAGHREAVQQLAEQQRARAVRDRLEAAEFALSAGRADEARALAGGLLETARRQGGLSPEEESRGLALERRARGRIHAWQPWISSKHGLVHVQEQEPDGVRVLRRVPLSSPRIGSVAEPPLPRSEGRGQPFVVVSRGTFSLLDASTLQPIREFLAGRKAPIPLEPEQMPGTDVLRWSPGQEHLDTPGADTALLPLVFPGRSMVVGVRLVSGGKLDGAVAWRRWLYPAPSGSAVPTGKGLLVPASQRLYLLDPLTGEPRGWWRTAGLITKAPAVAEETGLVLAAEDSARLMVWRVPPGWTRPGAAPVAADAGGEWIGDVELPGLPLSGAMVVGSFSVVPCSVSGRRTRFVIHRLQPPGPEPFEMAETLLERRGFEVEGLIRRPPVVAGGWLWFATDEGAVGALRLNPLADEVSTLAGTPPARSTPFRGLVAVAPIEDGEGLVVAGDVPDATQGALPGDGASLLAPVAGQEGRVEPTHGELRIYEARPFEGTPESRVWERSAVRLPGLLVAGPVVRGHRILVAVREPRSSGVTVVALALKDLREQARVRLSVPAAGDPLILSDGRVLVRRRDGALAEHHGGGDRLCRLLVSAGEEPGSGVPMPSPVLVPLMASADAVEEEDPSGPWVALGQSVRSSGSPQDSAALELRDAVTGWRHEGWRDSVTPALRGAVAARPLVLSRAGSRDLLVVPTTVGAVHVLELPSGRSAAQEYAPFRGLPFLAAAAAGQESDSRGSPWFLIGGDSGRLQRLALRLEDDGERAAVVTDWEVQGQAPFRSEPLVASGNVIVGDDDGVVRVVDASQGVVRGTLTVSGAVRTAPRLVRDATPEVAVVASLGGEVMGIDVGEARDLWRLRLGVAVRSLQVLDGGAAGWPPIVMAATDGGVLELISARDGRHLGRLSLGERATGSAVIDAREAEVTVALVTDRGFIVEVALDRRLLLAAGEAAVSQGSSDSQVLVAGPRRYRLLVEPGQEMLAEEQASLAALLGPGSDEATRRRVGVELQKLLEAGPLPIDQARARLRAIPLAVSRR